MIYVMSDLHGEYDKFIKMLDKIDFSDEDTLYILGDVLDRGKDAIKIIDYIRENNNIHLLMGNHELLFVMAYDNPEYMVHWIQNGGSSTYIELAERGFGYMKELYDYLISLPKYKIIDKFILVHAGINIPQNSENLSVEELMSAQEDDILLWDRGFIESSDYFKDYTVICGHTPTVKYMAENKKAKILHSQGKIMIDCGATFVDSNGRLGCLRLDDLEEFYID